MKIIVLRGLPGCGKTHFAKEYCEKNPSFVRVNRDDLRNMRGKYWIPKQEDLITQWEIGAIEEALLLQYNVILDSTNFNDSHVTKLLQAAKSVDPEAEIEFKGFDTTPEECIKRDLVRPNSVGSEVIWGMYWKYNPPKKYEENPLLTHCALVDLDGTLAEMRGRSPFDWNRVDEDAVQEHVKLIVNNYQLSNVTAPVPRQVVIFSGRDSVCAEKTADWLKDNNIQFHKLFMRPKGNTEKDAVIKRLMFEEYVRGKYYVDFVLDDRPQVLRMWHSLGLKVISNNPLNKEF